jgi:hypothetical protein
MKKYILIILFLNTFLTNAQTPQDLLRERKELKTAELREYNQGLVDTSGRYFYKTYNDYISNKPVLGIKYTGQRKLVFDTESVLVSEDEDFTYKKIKELPYWGFIDQWGQIERIFNNHCYYVLDTGKICCYVKAIDAEMTTDKNGNRSLKWLSENPDGAKDYLSESLTGPIIDFNEKKFKTMTVDYPEVFDQFLNEAIDNKAKDKRSLKTFKIKKYVRMYNTKQ